MKKLLLLSAILALSKIGQAQTVSAINGDCTLGGEQVLTQGMVSTATKQIGTGMPINHNAGVQASFPYCLVTVYNTGTITKATIYSTATLTPLSNPFSANADASWTLFAAQGAGYDIVLSSGTAPGAVAMPYSRTLTDVFLGGTGGGGGGITTVVAGTGLTGGGSSSSVTINLATPVAAANGGTGVSNTATLTLGTSNINFATLGTGIVKNTTTTGALSNAIASDVIILFSPNCTGANLLGADGGCHTAGTGTITGSGTTQILPIFTSATALGNSIFSQFPSSTGTNGLVSPTGLIGFDVLSTYPTSSSCAVGSPTIPTAIVPGATGCSRIQATGSYPGTMSSTSQTTGLYVSNGLNLSTIAEMAGGIFEVRPQSPVTLAVGVESDNYTNGSSSTVGQSVNFLGYNVGLSNTTTQQGLYLIGGVGTAVTVGNNYGVYVDSPSIGTGTLTHNYGLYVNDQAVTGSGTNSDPWALFTAGTAKSKFGGALTVAGNLTTNITGSTQCVQASTTGVLSGTGSPCGGGGGTTFGADLASLTGTTQEVVGILNNALPALSSGFLDWNGSSWVFTTPTSSVTITNGTGITGGGTGSSFTLAVTAPVVLTSQANTYTAGDKQTFGASATTAGLKFAGVTADPSGLSAGDVWFRSDLPYLSWYDGTNTQLLMNQSTKVTIAQMNDGTPGTGRMLYENTGGANFAWLSPGSPGCFLDISGSSLPQWEPNVCFTSSNLSVNGTVTATQFIGTGPYYLSTPAAGGALSAPGSGKSAFAVGSDNNFYFSINNGTFGQVPYIPGGAVAADQIAVGSAGGTFQADTLPSCSSSSCALGYNTTTHAFTSQAMLNSALATGHLFAGVAGVATDAGNDFTLNTSTHTIAAGASGVLTLAAAPAATGFKLPTASGASPTVDGNLAVNSTTHTLVYGSNGSTNTVSATIAASTATMATSAINSGTCATVVSVTGTGILTTDVVKWSFNGDPTAITGYAPAAGGVLRVVAYPTADHANFKICNDTAGNITPGGITFNWIVTR